MGCWGRGGVEGGGNVARDMNTRAAIFLYTTDCDDLFYRTV